MQTIFKALRIVAVLLAPILLAACPGGGGGGGGGVGTLRVAITDLPACGFDEVNITVKKVRVHQSSNADQNDGGWSEIDVNPPRKINLLDLMNGVLAELGQTLLPQGRYTQIRLVLEPNTGGSLANSVVPTGGTEQPLITPSGIQSGIKLINTFTVEAGQLTDIVLDFDACRSVVLLGNGGHLLKPVIKVIPRTATGIVGTIDPALTGVVVTAQKNGEVIRATVPNSIGEFALTPIDPAQSPYDVVITGTGRATAVVAAVPVVAGATTRISTTSMPISLPASGTPPTRTVSGTITPASALAEVRALQAVGTVPTVQIANVNANATTGAYLLTLPTGAPVLATYSTPLPLAFAPQGGSAGQYTIEASATGFVTQTAPANISAADVVLNFALVAAP